MRFAVEAYVTLARTSPWPVAVASSLTELFAPDLMAERAAAFRKHYTFVPGWGLEYFEARLTQAQRLGARPEPDADLLRHAGPAAGRRRRPGAEV